MSKNPYPVFTVSNKDQPERLKMKLKMFIRLYSKNQSAIIADTVVMHLGALLAHSNFKESAEQRYQYKTLEMHWRCLAWNARN